MENRGCVNPGDSPTIHSWMSRKWVGTSEESQLDKWKNFPGSASALVVGGGEQSFELRAESGLEDLEDSIRVG